MTPSTGPFFRASAGDMSTPISIANASVQIRKKLAEIMPLEAGCPLATAMRTSVATMCIHQATPTSTVTTELQRNHHRAFGMRLGITDCPGFGVQLLQERDVHQVEEVEQADPHDAGGDMDPSQEHEKQLAASGELDARQLKEQERR